MFDTLISAVRADWTLLLIPPISAFIGWFTNWVAIKMMFYPIKFVGIPPYLGWRGIIPANAHHLAGKTTDLITKQLVNLPMLFKNFDPDKFVGKLGPVLDETAEQILQEAVTKYGSAMWNSLAPDAQAQIKSLLRKEIEGVARAILHDFKHNIEDIVDLKKVILQVVNEDREMFGRLFQRVGANEFRFIETSGAYFGFLFGIPQMLQWILWPHWSSLPVGGFVVGYLTNWLALKMIFEPREPRRYGPIVWQGLFHKRQKQVAMDFAQMVSSYFLNPANIVRISSEGPTGEKTRAIVRKHVNALIDRYLQHPMAPMVLVGHDQQALRAEVLSRIDEEFKKPGGFMHVFAGDSVNIFDELKTRMEVLDSAQFEGLLRTPMQQDEWKLIVTGGVLGVIVGTLQVVYMYGDMLAQAAQVLPTSLP